MHTITCKCKQDGQQNAMPKYLEHHLPLPTTELSETGTALHMEHTVCISHITHCKHSQCAYLQCSNVHACVTKDPYAQVNIHASVWLQRLHKYLVQRTCAHSSVKQRQSPCRNVAAVIAPSKNAWRRSCLPQRTPRTSVT